MLIGIPSQVSAPLPGSAADLARVPARVNHRVVTLPARLSLSHWHTVTGADSIFLPPPGAEAEWERGNDGKGDVWVCGHGGPAPVR